MRSLLYIVLTALTSALSLSAQSGLRLSVIDSLTREPLDAVHIIYGVRRGTFTDTSGHALLPEGLSLDTQVEVRSMGYKHRHVRLGELPRSRGTYVVALSPDTESLQALVVQAERRATSINTISQRIGTAEIDRHAGRSLADLLESVSGVSSIKSGTGASKPVIHGMYGTRILIVNNGVRQSGQQWGEGHAPELDMSGSQAVHVVKGAEGVRYGSEALGGVVVLEDRPLRYGASDLSGQVGLGGDTNGRRITTTARLDGAVPGLSSLAWRVQGMYTSSGDQSAARYLLNNTGERTSNLGLALGYELGRLRLEGSYTRYASRHGIPRYAELGSVQIFKERVAYGQPFPEMLTPYTRAIDYPYEQVVHQTLTGRASYHLPSCGDLLYQLSYQTDSRQEYRIRRTSSSIPEVDLSLRSLQHRLRWDYSYGAWQTEAGLQYQNTDNHNVPGTGVVPTIPNYVERTWGGYALQKLALGKFTAEAGLRFDGQYTEASGYDIVGDLYGGRRTFANMSYTLGASYELTKGLRLTTNAGTAWRAPHVYELYAHGSDHGSAAFVKGDSTLRSERSVKWVTSLEYRTGILHVALDGYLQWVDGYIYDEPQLHSDGSPVVHTLISGAYPVFQFRQTGAFFRGADLHIHLHPLEHLTYSLTTALIWANEASTGAYLPFIAPPRIDHSLAYHCTLSKGLTGSAELGHRYVAKQTRYEPHRDLVRDTPDAYHLLSAELSLEWSLPRGQSLSVALSGENLLNTEYKDYTNRARYYSHDLGRDLRLRIGWQF